MSCSQVTQWPDPIFILQFAKPPFAALLSSLGDPPSPTATVDPGVEVTFPDRGTSGPPGTVRREEVGQPVRASGMGI